MADFDRESMLEMFIYEMSQLLEQLEQIVIQGESGFSMAQINEIFRIMHTIKGSAGMMMFENISTTAHSMEDLFFYLREENPTMVDYSGLTDLILEGMDFIKVELNKLENGEPLDGDGSDIISRNKTFLAQLKGEKKEVPPAGQYHYHCTIMFDDGCEMENVRAYTLVHNLKNDATILSQVPEDVIEESSIEFIRRDGFQFEFTSHHAYDDMADILNKTVYLKDMVLEQIQEQAAQITKTKEAMPSQKDFNVFEATVFFEDGCEMENVRAFTLIHNIETVFEIVTHTPVDLIPETTIPQIQQDGFKIHIETSKSYDETYKILSQTIYLKELRLAEQIQEAPIVSVASTLEVPAETMLPKANLEEQKNAPAQGGKKSQGQHVISVNVSKLDQLLNLMGELVIAEAMVTQNPEIEGLELDSFYKEARQLRKIINDVQDTVMSMRMVPLSTTFFKMHRIVRDMCKSLNKDVQLDIIGEETEVDKNIIEHISDPLMHIIRNSIDHGIEMPEDRKAKGKSKQGVVRLEAKNSGGDVLIIIKDDGAGLDKTRIMAKAKSNGLLRKPEDEYSDKEIYQFIFLPGFSTNEVVTGYSGRGVGMDVVSTNLEAVGGTVLVDSVPGEGSTFTLKIPLTLAIIEGMTIMMGNAKYTIPIISIKQSFKPSKDSLFVDPSGNEMITVRGECYNVIRLSEFFDVASSISDMEEGIMIMLENGEQTVCVLVDELIGEQQVVVKSIPKYIKKVRGISGCTLLGNGDISLIIDVAGFFDK